GQLLPGMAYLVRRLLENTANDSFLRASFTENVSEEQLLMNPDRGDRLAACPSPDGQAASLSPRFANEPLADFSRSDARDAMQIALREVAGQFGRSYPLVIGNQPISTQATIDSVNPSHSRQIVGRCGKATPDDAERAIVTASAAFPAWRDTEPKER